MPNRNLTSAEALPGFYGYTDYNAQGNGLAPNRRVLLMGYVTASAQRTPNMPFRPSSQQDVDDGCGQNSDAANSYAACVSQPESAGAELWVAPLTPPSGGVASIYEIQVFGAPSQSGTIALWINSIPIPQVGFTTTDTATTIGDAIAAAILSVKTLPISSCVNASGVLTITYIHKGTTGEDLPMRANITPNGTGVNIGAQLTCATNATGVGSVKIDFGALSVSTTLAGGETPAQVASKIAASFTADTYPLTAVVDSVTSKVDLYFQNNKDVRRIRASVITTTGLTVALGGGSATDGSGSPTSYTYNGTLGTGAPTLTGLLANLSNLDQFRAWVSPFLDATSLGAMATQIEAAANGSINGQRQQTLTACSTDGIATAGAVAPAVSPNLTTTAPRYAIGWSPDAPVKGAELAARVAAARAAFWIDQPQKNWNGFKIQGNTRSPVLLPPKKPDELTQNSALVTYGLFPIVIGPSGNLEVVKGRTTSLAPDKRLWAWSSEAQASFHWVDLAERFQSILQGGNIVRYSTPRSPGLFDTDSVKGIIADAMDAWEAAGNYDGAAKFKDSIDVVINSQNPFRFDADFPESPVLDLDQVAFASHFSSPSQ